MQATELDRWRLEVHVSWVVVGRQATEMGSWRLEVHFPWVVGERKAPDIDR